MVEYAYVEYQAVPITKSIRTMYVMDEVLYKLEVVSIVLMPTRRSPKVDTTDLS